MMWLVEAKNGVVTHSGMPRDLADFIGIRLIFIHEMRQSKRYADADAVRDDLKSEVLKYWYGELSEFYMDDDAAYDSLRVKIGKDGISVEVDPYWLENRYGRALYRAELAQSAKDVAIFMSSIPTLMNTPGGIAEINRTYKQLLERKKQEEGIARKLLREDGNLERFYAETEKLGPVFKSAPAAPAAPAFDRSAIEAEMKRRMIK